MGDTADGPVVLTFETAHDDPGLSSIGLFRIWLSNALFMRTEENYNGSFESKRKLPKERPSGSFSFAFRFWGLLAKRHICRHASPQPSRKGAVELNGGLVDHVAAQGGGNGRNENDLAAESFVKGFNKH